MIGNPCIDGLSQRQENFPLEQQMNIRSLKKEEQLSDYQEGNSDANDEVDQMILKDQVDKVPSQYFRQYLNYFNLPFTHQFVQPQIDQEISINLRKNKILYHKQVLNKKIEIKVIKSSPSYSVVDLEVLIGYFNVPIRILNFDEQILKLNSFEEAQRIKEVKGNFGQIQIIDWDEFLHSKDLFKVDQLKDFEDESSKLNSFQTKKYATKIFYFPEKKSFVERQAQFKYEKIYNYIIEYTICKIASCFKIGLSTEHPFGFDLVCYKNCIQFFMEKGLSLAEYVSQNLDSVVSELKIKLLSLHSLHIVHRDIKFDNFLYSPTYKSTVFIDFGLSDVINQSFGQKTKSTYKGSYFFLSQEVKRLMFEEHNFYVDLFWNDVVGLIKTRNIFKSLFENRIQAKFDNRKEALGVQFGNKEKEKRIQHMKHYLKIKVLSIINQKNVQLVSEIVQSFRTSEQTLWIQWVTKFLQTLQSCPAYEELKDKLKKLSIKISFKNAKKFAYMDNIEEKQNFFMRYESSPKDIQLQIKKYDNNWKKPLQSLCKQYLKTKRPQTQFSILTYSISVLFQNINSMAYIFKKLYRTFPQKIINFMEREYDGKFIFKKIANKQDLSQQISQNPSEDLKNLNGQQRLSQKFILVKNYIIEINKYSAIIITSYMQDVISFLLKFQSQSYKNGKNETLNIDPLFEKHFIIKKSVLNKYFTEHSIPQKILLLLFKVYIKESSLKQVQRLFFTKIKRYCSKVVYLKHYLSLFNFSVHMISFKKFEFFVNEIKQLAQQIKNQNQERLKSSNNSEKPVTSNQIYEKKRKELVEVMEFQIFMCYIKYKIFHQVCQENAQQIRQQIVQKGYIFLDRFQLKIDYEFFCMKKFDLLSMHINCNIILDRELQNMSLLQKYYDCLVIICSQANIFQSFQITNYYLDEEMKKFRNKQLKRSLEQSLIDPSSFVIQFDNDLQYSEKFNYSIFKHEVTSKNINDRNSILSKLDQVLERVQKRPKWEMEEDQQFFIRKNFYLLNFLEFTFREKLYDKYQQLRSRIQSNFKQIIGFLIKSQRERSNKFRQLQKIIQTFLGLGDLSQANFIQSLYFQFVQSVQSSFNHQQEYPSMYWIAKACLFNSDKFMQGCKIVSQTNSQKQRPLNSEFYYIKLVQFHPLQKNSITFKNIGFYIEMKLKQNTIPSKNFKAIIDRFVSYLLSEQMAFFICREKKVAIKLLRFLLEDKKYEEFSKVLALICRHVSKIRPSKKQAFNDLVQKICGQSFYRYTEQVIHKIDSCISSIVCQQNGQRNMEVLDLFHFWIVLMYQTKSFIFTQRLRSIVSSIDFLSIRSKESIYRYYFQMGATCMKREGEFKKFRKFLRYDLRKNGVINKQLYVSFFFSHLQFAYLAHNLKSLKDSCPHFNHLGNIQLNRRKILDKVVQIKRLMM